MKHLLTTLTCICAILFACTEKDLYQGTSTSPKGDFSFQNTKKKSITIFAKNSSGEYTANVPVSIYPESPYNENGNIKENISRIAYGVTNESGKLSIEISKIPAKCTELYILTEWPGFGGMQTFDLEAGSEMILSGPQIETNKSKAISRANDDEESFEGKVVNSTMNLYTYLNQWDSKGRPVVDGNLVNDITISKDLVKLVSEWYPEKKNVQDETFLTDPVYCTDMEIKDEYGCEIWVTYLGDGGFSNSNASIRNMLCYYQYEGGHTALQQPADSKRVHKTIIFNNTNQREMPCGRKVQLLYWDGSKYVKVFPKGTYIGWALIQEGLDTKAQYITNNINDVNKYRFSTLELSTVGNVKITQGIARWSEEHNCNIVGMENREMEHRAYDGDYNDVLFCVTATPRIKPDVVIPAPGENGNNSEESNDTKKSEVYGTLAFEDMHPHKGDWDHNDFVVDYTYTKEQNISTGKVTAIELDFKARAIGGQRSSGFGIELPVKFSNVARVIGANLESTKNDGDKICICIKENTREFFNSQTGIINTRPESGKIDASNSVGIRIELKNPDTDSNVQFSKFNPFIFVDSRDNEIHLSDYKPTSLGKVSFGIHDDATDGINTFYKTNEGHAWGLDIPRTNAEQAGWIYPIENIEINQAYPQYTEWVESNGTKNQTWYEYPDKEKVYQK